MLQLRKESADMTASVQRTWLALRTSALMFVASEIHAAKMQFVQQQITGQFVGVPQH